MEQTIRIDDIDQSAIDVQQVIFSLGKDHYEIDLGPEKRHELIEALAPFIEKARKAKRSPKRAPNGDAQRRKEIRQWATSNGFTVAASGKIPENITAAYNVANRGTRDS